MAKLRYWLPPLLWMTLIFALSSRPALHAASVNWQDFIIKKTAHFTEYFVLAWLMFRSLKQSAKFSLTALLTLTLTLTILYAASDEYHQTFIVGREGRLRDVLIDSVGAAVACLVIRRTKYSINTTG